MSFDTRRIVTGHDAQGRAVVISDRRLAAEQVPDASVWFNKIWTSEGWPADNTDPADGAERPTGLALGNGSVLRIIEMGPGHRSPMHRTDSLDYGILLAGEVDLELDDNRRVSLNVGDVVIQRGTIHAWINRGTETARMAFVLLGATPLESPE
jgi:quercetin dioxygenase-like cupin family protein